MNALTDDISVAGVERAFREGPYGRCVYLGDNDVVDHQVVNLEFRGGATASVTVVAFTELAFRKTRVFGSHGSLESDGSTIVVHDFATGTQEVVHPLDPAGSSAASGHGGADGALIRDFLGAVATGDATLIRSGPRETLASHDVVWAAEESRLTGTVVSV